MNRQHDDWPHLGRSQVTGFEVRLLSHVSQTKHGVDMPQIEHGGEVQLPGGQ